MDVDVDVGGRRQRRGHVDPIHSHHVLGHAASWREDVQSEVWEAGETTGTHCMCEGGESRPLVKIPRGFPVQVSMSE